MGARSPRVGPGDGCWGSSHQRGRPPSAGTARVGTGRLGQKRPTALSCCCVEAAAPQAGAARGGRLQSRAPEDGCFGPSRPVLQPVPARSPLVPAGLPPAVPEVARQLRPAPALGPRGLGLHLAGKRGGVGGPSVRAGRAPRGHRAQRWAVRGVAAEATSPRSRCGGAGGGGGAGMEQERGRDTRQLPSVRLAPGTDSWLGGTPPSPRAPPASPPPPRVRAPTRGRCER